MPSGRGWNRLQPGEGAAELLRPGPAIWKMQGQPACRAGEPSGQGEAPPPEGLGGDYPLSQTEPRRPTGQVMRHHLGGEPGSVGGDQRHQLVAGVGSSWGIAQVEALLDGLGQAKVPGQGDREVPARHWLPGGGRRR